MVVKGHLLSDYEREQIEAFLNARAQREMAAIDGVSPRRDTLFSDLLESADRVTRFRGQSDDFSEFLQLQLAVQEVCPDAALAPLPPKRELKTHHSGGAAVNGAGER